MQLLYEIQKGKVYDICFSDVKMPQMNGIELAEKVREIDTNVFWVFLSYYPEYAIKGYGVDAYEYLLKEELEEKWEDFWKKLRCRLKEEKGKTYILEYNNYFDKIYRRHIQYIYKSGKNVIFVLPDREIMIRRSLKEVYEELGTDSEFIRVERGYIVNMEQIRRVGSKEIIMDTGAVIPVGRIHAQIAMERIGKYWRNSNI